MKTKSFIETVKPNRKHVEINIKIKLIIARERLNHESCYAIRKVNFRLTKVIQHVRVEI